jgi:hypothetical protein
MGPPRELTPREKKRNAANAREYRRRKRNDPEWMRKEAARRMVKYFLAIK